MNNVVQGPRVRFGAKTIRKADATGHVDCVAYSKQTSFDPSRACAVRSAECAMLGVSRRARPRARSPSGMGDLRSADNTRSSKVDLDVAADLLQLRCLASTPSA
jgi:hypothetical protein